MGDFNLVVWFSRWFVSFIENGYLDWFCYLKCFVLIIFEEIICVNGCYVVNII